MSRTAPSLRTATTPDSDSPRPKANIRRVLVTILGTLLVVGTEFALLHLVYARSKPVRSQLAVATRLTGAAAVASPADTTSLRAAAAETVRQLSGAGVSSAELTAVDTAATKLSASPARAIPELRTAAADLRHSLRQRAAVLDDEADVIYVLLLLVASVGWMIWFRRLVARHRALQREVTEHRAQALGEQRLAALVRNSADAVMICDPDGRITFVTPSVHNVLGHEPDDLIGTSATEIVHADHLERFVRSLSSVAAGTDDTVNSRMRHADGRFLDVEGTLTNLLHHEAVDGLVVTIRDISTRVELENELTHQAFHDALTGLANRQLFTDRLEHALHARSGAPELTVLFCDLDEFKNINDSLGHDAGDQAIAEVARRIQRVTRSRDTTARLGGDEFAILLEDTGLDEALVVAEHISAALVDSVEVSGQPVLVRASIGVAVGAPGAATAGELLRNADVAMYLAKSRGKGTVAVYDEQLHHEALDRLSLNAELQHAIRNDEIVAYYQPTIDLRSGAVVGFEALARWQHPERGTIGPYEFIPAAEQSGLIHALGASMLRQACAAAVELSAAASCPLTMSVNITASQLARHDFVDEVLDALRASGLPAEQLIVELTESALLDDVDVARDRLSELRAHGVRVAIDDFGTGYSSLAYLRGLPLDILKLDKVFVDNVTTDAGDAALANSIVAIGQSMNLTTVAEGVEHPEQAAWLTDAECTYGQGFLWARPMPGDEAKALASSIRLAAERRAVDGDELLSA